MKAYYIILLISLFCLGPHENVPAAEKAPAQTAPGKPARKLTGRPFKGKIKLVDQSARRIVLEGAKAQTFLITSETRINKDDEPATFNDLKAGEPVTGYARQTPDGTWEARSIYAGKRAATKPKN